MAGLELGNTWRIITADSQASLPDRLTNPADYEANVEHLTDPVVVLSEDKAN